MMGENIYISKLSLDPETGKTEVLSVPQHVAVIMDGNGRWAAQRGLPRVEGHRRGMQAFRRAIEAADALGIRYLTVYSFSSENWNRPEQEVSELMKLLKFFIRSDLASLNRKNVRIRVIGERATLSPDIQDLLESAEEATKKNTGLTLVVAFNYGGRQEIVRSVCRIAEKLLNHEIDKTDITPDLIQSHLDTHDIPDPDLLIRTSGEQRISNFLTWQLSYTEFVFIPDYWPDFTGETLKKALKEFAQRDRRFGALSPTNENRG